MARKKKEINYNEVFFIPDIYWQPYPVYSVAGSGNLYNIKSIIYPSPSSRKKFTRRRQLVKRSVQAKIFDALINIGYFSPLLVVREFPVIINNSLRLPGQVGGYYLLDYFFPTALGGKGLCIELDSELHNADRDEVRDDYLSQLGITVFRITGLDKEVTQKGKFKKMTELLRSTPPSSAPVPFDFRNYTSGKA